MHKSIKTQNKQNIVAVKKRKCGMVHKFINDEEEDLF